VKERIRNADALEWDDIRHGDRFGFRRKRLGFETGGRKLGATLYEVPPGRSTWPYHYHAANEEAIFVLEGEGTLRLGGIEHGIRAGDYVTLPVGPEGCHQIHNRSAAPLRLLMMSTMIEPDVAFYPDSGKIGIFTGSAPGGDRSAFTIRKYVPAGSEVDYWDGE
jgi:uncharacterized cupin superfamily protein